MDASSDSYVTNIQKKQSACLIRLDEEGNIYNKDDS